MKRPEEDPLALAEIKRRKIRARDAAMQAAAARPKQAPVGYDFANLKTFMVFGIPVEHPIPYPSRDLGEGGNVRTAFNGFPIGTMRSNILYSSSSGLGVT